jgi:AhpC/TSA antioxidant enzyme
VRDRLDELGDARVVLVTFTRPRNLAGFRRRLGVPFPVVADETRAVYRAYGLGRGSWWRVYGLDTLRAYGRLLRRGRRLQRPTEDTLQLGGDFVVGPDGRLAYTYRSRVPDDRPPIDELVDAVRRRH